jgi:hypothetical protein
MTLIFLGFICENLCNLWLSVFLLFDDGVVDEQIGKVFSNDLTGIVDGYASLLFDFEAEGAEFDGEGIFVDFFEEAVAKGVVNRVEGFDDQFSEAFVFGFHNKYRYAALYRRRCLVVATQFGMPDFWVARDCRTKFSPEVMLTRRREPFRCVRAVRLTISFAESIQPRFRKG